MQGGELTSLGSILMGAFLAFYVAKLAWYIPAYRDMHTYVEFNLMDFPDQYACWNWMGVLYRERKQLFAAMYNWGRGLKHRPTCFRMNFNLYQAFLALGQGDTARHFLEQAGKGLRPDVRERQARLLAEQDAAVLRRMGVNGGD